MYLKHNKYSHSMYPILLHHKKKRFRIWRTNR